MERKAQFPRTEYTSLVTPGAIDEFYHFLPNERKFMEANGYSQILYPPVGRRYAVKFIEELVSDYMEKYNYEDFDAMIPCMAMTYYDRFTSRELIPRQSEKNVNLCILCCLSIAWKYFLSDFVPFRIGDFVAWSNVEMLKMELLICRQLEWRLETVTPFELADYMIPFLSLEPSSPSPRRPTRHLIVKSHADIVFIHYMPSVIAASALLTVYSEMYPDRYNYMEEKILRTFTSLSKDEVAQCREKIARIYKISPQCITPIITMNENMEGESNIGTFFAEDEHWMDFKLGWSEVLDAEKLS